MTACPTDEALAALLERGHAERERTELLAHVEGCASCLELVGAMLGPLGRAQGDLLAGRYRLGALRGAGAMGAVYAAFDEELRRPVAIKLLRGDRLRASDGAERLRAEARALARVSSPYVVAVHDVVRLDGGELCLAMELVEGGTLRQWLAAPRRVGERLAMFAQVARGLAAAHAADVIHRDFKPENVLVGDDGRPRVGDFGLAHAVEGAASTPGGVVGTPAYMAPEQARGESATAAADQYAFAVALVEAFTGERTRATRGDLTGLPARVRAVAARALSAEPPQRWRSLEDVAQRLERAQAAPRRHVATALVILAVLLSGAGAWWVASRGTVAPTCDGGAVEVAGLWTPALAQAAHALGDGVEARIAGGVVGWRDAWARERDLACRAAGGHPAAERSARGQCLTRQRVMAEAVVAALGDGPMGDPAAVIRAVQSLPAPPACALVDTEPAAPPDAVALALEADLAREVAARLTGRGATSSVELSNLVARAKDLGRFELAARGHLEQAQAALASGRHGEARVAADAAVALALEHDEPTTLLSALAVLADVQAADGDRAGALRTIAQARAVLRGQGADAGRAAALDLAECTAESITEQALEVAYAACARGRAALAAAYGPDDLRIADAARRTGDVAWRRGAYEQARGDYLAAQEVVRRVVPGDTPLTRSIENDLAHVEMVTGDPARAAEVFRRLIARDPDHPLWRDSLGMAARQLGDYAGEVAARTEALPRCQRQGNAQCELWQHVNLAFALAQLGRLDEAQAHLAALDALAAQPSPVDQAQVALVRTQQAQARGDLAQAGEQLDRAKQLLASFRNSRDVEHLHALAARLTQP